MKRSTNILVMISVITLTCGQLHGLTPEQSVELNQLKKQLEARYAKGIPSIKPMEWLLKNGAIIEQIEELDLSSASAYKGEQNLLFKKIQKEAKKEAKKSAEIVKLIRNNIKKVK